MEKFGKNFKAGRESVPCPLCKKHEDGEEESFSICEVTADKIDNKADFDEIFDENLKKETVDSLTIIMNLRDNHAYEEEETN